MILPQGMPDETANTILLPVLSVDRTPKTVSLRAISADDGDTTMTRARPKIAVAQFSCALARAVIYFEVYIISAAVYRTIYKPRL